MKIRLAVIFSVALPSLVYASISRISQLGLEPGMIADSQADTYLTNPAFGTEYKAAELSIMNSTSMSGSYFDDYCYESLTNKCHAIPINSFKEDLSVLFAIPITERFGFFMNLNPEYDTYTNSESIKREHIYTAINPGLWFGLSEKLSLGLSASLYLYYYNYSDDVQPMEPLFCLSDASLGVRFHTDEFELAYSYKMSVRRDYWQYFSVQLQEFYNPAERTNSVYNIHNAVLRFPLTPNLRIENKISFVNRYESQHYWGQITSIFGYTLENIYWFAGLNYQLESDEAAPLILTENGNSLIYFNNNIHAILGAEMHVLKWLDFRLGFRFMNFGFAFFNDKNYVNHYDVSIYPGLFGGVNFILSENSDLEVALSSNTLGVSLPDTHFNLSFQWNIRFSTGKPS